MEGKFDRGLKLEMAPARPAMDVMQELDIPVVSHWLWQESMLRYYAQPVLFEDLNVMLSQIGTYHDGKIVIPQAGDRLRCRVGAVCQLGSASAGGGGGALGRGACSTAATRAAAAAGSRE